MKKNLYSIFSKCYYKGINDSFFEKTSSLLEIILSSGYDYTIDSHDIWTFTRFYFYIKQNLEQLIKKQREENKYSSFIARRVQNHKLKELEKAKSNFTLFENMFENELKISFSTVKNMIEMEKEKFGYKF